MRRRKSTTFWKKSFSSRSRSQSKKNLPRKSMITLRSRSSTPLPQSRRKSRRRRKRRKNN
jgi:hypothetical protein